MRSARANNEKKDSGVAHGNCSVKQQRQRQVNFSDNKQKRQCRWQQQQQQTRQQPQQPRQQHQQQSAYNDYNSDDSYFSPTDIRRRAVIAAPQQPYSSRTDYRSVGMRIAQHFYDDLEY
uniref:Uncharacterized protein n=1 Tax=Ceratitis capitata TaxID=7213 RepID=W8C6H8_CERCA